jgi:hypothetical protein
MFSVNASHTRHGLILFHVAVENQVAVSVSFNSDNINSSELKGSKKIESLREANRNLS